MFWQEKESSALTWHAISYLEHMQHLHRCMVTCRYPDLCITTVGSVVLGVLLHHKCKQMAAFNTVAQRIANAFVVDFGSLVLPLCWIVLFPKSGIILSVGALVLSQRFGPNYGSRTVEEPMATPRPFATNVLPSLCAYRAALTLLTCFSILAVDFNVFPRHHAKTESFGVSLMDLGTGSVVCIGHWRCMWIMMIVYRILHQYNNAFVLFESGWLFTLFNCE